MPWSNIDVRVEGFKLIYEIDLSVDLGPSSTGKTNLVGTTGGPKPVPDFLGFSGAINVFMKKEKIPADLMKRLKAERKKQRSMQEGGGGGSGVKK